MSNERKRSEANTNMLEVKPGETKTPITGEPPGSSLERNGISIEGLGFIDLDEEMAKPLENFEDGSGPFFVVTFDAFTGANGQGFKKGDVRRLSHLVQGFGEKGSDKEAVKARVAQLMRNGAMRPASPDEEKTGQASVDSNESMEMKAERQRRINAERELERLRESNPATGSKTPSGPINPQTGKAPEEGEEGWGV